MAILKQPEHAARYAEIMRAFDEKKPVKEEDGLTVLIRVGNLMLAGICESTQSRKDTFRDVRINRADYPVVSVDSILGESVIRTIPR